MKNYIAFINLNVQLDQRFAKAAQLSGFLYLWITLILILFKAKHYNIIGIFFKNKYVKYRTIIKGLKEIGFFIPCN